MEYRRILLDGNVVEVVLDGDTLVAADGRRVEAATAHTWLRSHPPRFCAAI